ncbi:hypothetical protein [Streptomyces sp. NPDC052535]|uniref:hypothetical protein n=1 Tax=Streptomyces sp. NPDC052535 TaxID=3155531 RepID=UPI00342D5A7F
MTDQTTTDRHVAEARRAVHESLTLLPAWEADRVRSLIADLESAVESRTAVRMADAVPLPGSTGISACCGRPPCEFVGERVTRDPDKVTCTGPVAGARQDGVQQ